MAWLVGLLTALAALGLGFAAADGSHSVVVGLYRRGILPFGGQARARAALNAYRPGRGAAERLDLPPAVQATLAILRRPSPFIVLPAVGGWLLGILARDVLFSSYLVLLGLGASLYLAYRQTLRARQTVSDEVRHLVDAFVGLYRVNPTTFTTLGLAAEHVPAGWVRDAALAEIKRHLRDFIGANTWEELCREWLLRASAQQAVPVLVDQVGSAWTRAAQVDVVGINSMAKTLVLGECKWGPEPSGRSVLTELVEKTAEIVPSQGRWQVSYLGFARAGWTPASQALAEEIASAPPSGKNWRAGGMRLLDLAQVDHNLAAWVSGQAA